MKRSLRAAIAEATGRGWATGHDVTSAPRMSTTPSVAYGVECGQILAAVESAPVPAAEWMLVAYGAPGYVSQEVYERVLDRLRICSVIECGAPRSPRFDAFLEASASALAQRNLTREPMSFRAIARRAGVDPRSKAVWDARLASVERAVEGWERLVAGSVKRHLRSLTGEATLQAC